jgi:hypothetical protein
MRATPVDTEHPLLARTVVVGDDVPPASVGEHALAA